MVDAAEGIHHSDMEETKRRVGTDSDSCCPLQYPPELRTPSTPGPESAFNRDHDLLSSTKIANIQYARKDAKTTNSGSMGA
jgi:hypothetical protein